MLIPASQQNSIWGEEFTSRPQFWILLFSKTVYCLDRTSNLHKFAASNIISQEQIFSNNSTRSTHVLTRYFSCSQFPILKLNSPFLFIPVLSPLIFMKQLSVDMFPDCCLVLKTSDNKETLWNWNIGPVKVNLSTKIDLKVFWHVCQATTQKMFRLTWSHITQCETF